MQNFFLFSISLLLVTFGQPAWIPLLGIPSALIGFALFWKAMLSFPERKQRFWISFAWFFSIQLVQLSWFLSHPFYYIYTVWLFLASLMAFQFGLLSLFFDAKKITHYPRMLAVASFWTIMEWSRLFILSGSSFNPVGLAFAVNPISMQFASVAGVFGLSFLVIFINLLALKVWIDRYTVKSIGLFAAVAILPFGFGIIHYSYHDGMMQKLAEDPTNQHFSAVLVQTAFPVEEAMHFNDRKQYYDFVVGEWKQMLQIVKKHQGKPVNLVALPELVVPFGTYSLVYPFEEAKKVFVDTFGAEVEKQLPTLDYPLAYKINTEGSTQWMVNNAYWVQALANIFDAGVVIGLEDAEDINDEREYYSAAIYIIPESQRKTDSFQAQRYSKQVLVPMGEYIPFSFCRNLAAQYGVFGSFSCGRQAKVWQQNNTSFGLSICYEEMYGNMMRQNKVNGANFLLNITSDAWFPHSKLIRQHLEHARLRTVENGFPLLRACNTGVTCAVDSLGRDIAVLGDSDHTREDLSDSLYVSLPIYNYQTIYTLVGDWLIMAISFFMLFVFFRYR
jgi:apolipoprotein N-acyltransferase